MTEKEFIIFLFKNETIDDIKIEQLFKNNKLDNNQIKELKTKYENMKLTIELYDFYYNKNSLVSISFDMMLSLENINLHTILKDGFKLTKLSNCNHNEKYFYVISDCYNYILELYYID